MPFFRSQSRLDREQPRLRPLAVTGALLLVGAWTAWFVASTVAVYSVSSSARLEIDRSSYPVATPVAGRVVSAGLRTGAEVKEGDVLLELDVRSQDFELGEEQARLQGLVPQLEGLAAEIAEQEAHRRDAAAAAEAERAEAVSRLNEAVAAADLAGDQQARTTQLSSAGLVAEAELARVRSDVKQRRAAAETLRLAIERADVERRRTDTELRIEIDRLRRQAAALRAAQGTGEATAARLRHEGTLRRITAPVTGTLAEVADLKSGAFLAEGATVATVVPHGALRVVASFLPADAFGRIAVGQPARLRLDGFPFTQYGRLDAVVTSVARELRDGLVRIELTLKDAATAVPIQHGLPGTVEVEVEQISPAALVLRAAGRRLAPTVAAAAAR